MSAKSSTEPHRHPGARELEEAEYLHRQLLDNAIDAAIFGLDLEGRVTRWNQGASNILGYTPDEIRGLSAALFFVAEDRAAGRLQIELARAVAQGRAECGGWRLRKNGERFWSSGRLAPLRDESGRVTGFAAVLHDRTQERDASQALDLSRDQLRLAQTAGGIGAFVIDVTNNEMLLTPEFCLLFGLPPRSRAAPEEFERLVLPPDDAAASHRSTRGDGTAPLDVEYRIRRASDGAIRWIGRKGEFVRDPDTGKILQMLGVAQDVTERKQAEQALRDSEAKFRTFAQAVPNQIWTAPPDGKLDWLNERVFEYCGVPLEDLRDDGWARIVHPDDLPAAAERWRAALESGQTYEAEFRIRRFDGVYRWHLVRALPIVENGTLRRWVGTNTDIEDQRAALAVLAASNQKLEDEVTQRTAELDRIWRHSRDLLVVIGADGIFRSVSPSWSSILGHRPEDVFGRSFLEFVWPEDAASTRDRLASAASGASHGHFENRYRHRDGTPRWISWQSATVDEMVYAYGRDVTAEKEQAEALLLAEEQLRQSQKMEAVGQLTGGLAHDFNNLLTGVIGSLELLQIRMDQGRLDGASRYIQAALGASRRAAALTHRLLAFSRRQTLDPRAIGINRLVTGMEELIRGTVGPGIEVEVVGAIGLWNSFVDPHQLENALLNLCINARDAMPDGGRLTIETGNRWMDVRGARERDIPAGQYVSLCVSDTGSGMSPEVAARAFEPFFTTKPLGMGTGLGLSMIYGFAQQSGGQVRIYSEPGQGTMVCIYLPRHHGDEDAQDERVECIRPTPAIEGETVLVIDDEASIRMLVTDVLHDLGYSALEAADGAAGLSILESGVRIDLLVTDVGLPGGINGRQVADAARALRKDLRVLFITGYAENAVIGNGHLEPGMQVLTKPFAMEDLAHRLQDLMRGTNGGVRRP